MSSMPVLVLNSGSSSIKFSVYEASGANRTRLFDGAVDGISTGQVPAFLHPATSRAAHSGGSVMDRNVPSARCSVWPSSLMS